MSALDNIQAADITVQKIHAESGFSAAESLKMRIKIAKNNLAKAIRYERKTEPYRTQWLEQVEAYRAHIADLQSR